MKNDSSVQSPRGPRGAKPTSKSTGELIPQPHGGALLAGGVPGNRGGVGQPPSVIRSLSREAWAERLPVLTTIADGEAVQTIDVPLASVLPHAKCPSCRGNLAAKNPSTAAIVSVRGKASAKPSERVRAMSELSKVGMGAAMSPDDLRERMREQLTVIASRPTWNAEELIKALLPIWQ